MHLSIGLLAVAAAALGLSPPVMQSAVASDRALRAILEREKCVADRLATNRRSPRVVVYEVACRQSARLLRVTCLDDECYLQLPPRDDDGPPSD